MAEVRAVIETILKTHWLHVFQVWFSLQMTLYAQ